MSQQAQQPQQVDLKSLSINDCKALVYDRLALIEATQKEIQLINQEIALKNQSTQNSLRPELVEKNNA